MKLRWLLPSLALALLSADADAATLNPGDAAPPLKIGQWMKGDAVEKLEPGQVYVVEFWATWCGPCRTSIPHLTELTTKFNGKATFIGVSVFEHEKTDEERIKKVGDFVTEMGSKMDYRVAADAADKTMATNWMEASGERGIPTAFIVDMEGKIAWIGHPMGDLEKTLDAVVEAKWDVKAFAAERAKARSADEEEQKLMTPILKLARENKPKEAIEALDKVIAEHADYAEKTGFFRFSLLVKSDEPAAYAFAKQLADGAFKNEPQGLAALARMIGAEDRKAPDADLALSLAERASELRKGEDAGLLGTLADAQFRKGDAAKAAATQEAAIAALAKVPNVPERTTKSFADKLTKFRAGGAKPAPEAK